jgi:regulatory protein
MLTEKQLSDAIRRKAREKFDGISEAQLRACSEFAVKFAYDNKALDDTAYAEVATRSAVRSGRSKRAIAQRLAIKGIARETATAALEEADDLYAAVVLARKRAFGPFRKADVDDKRMVKEMSAFARGGFGFELARKVLAMSLDDAEDLLHDRRL